MTRRRANTFVVALLVLGCGDPATTEPFVPKVTTVSVSGANGQLVIDQTLQLSAVAADQNGAAMTGLTFTWTTSNAAIATVSQAGLVTAVGEGIFQITATTAGKSGTFDGSAASLFTIARTAGDNQHGITGKALADSLVISVTTATGAPAANQSVTLTPSAGTLSSTTVTTDASGVARVQWLAGSGDATTTARISGAIPAVFHANGRTSGSCILRPSAATKNFGLGPGNYTTLSLAPKAAHKVVALFVDFSDVPATETTASLETSVIDPGIALLSELSYGRSSFSVTTVDKWYRMSKTSSSYGFDGLTFQAQKEFIGEAMMLADADVDYAQYDAVYVFAAPTANIPVSPTFNAFAGGGVTLDGKEIHNGVTFGNDARRPDGYGAHVLAHETGHMLGLIDLYSLTGQDVSTLERYMATVLKYVGAWSLMGFTGKSGHWFAYEKLKLGYLDDNQVTCISPSTGGVEEVVTPIETAGGVKAVMVQLDTSRALVAEVRAATGSDTTLCSQGVLIYQVDAQIPTGAGAVVIRPSKVGTDQAKINTCGTYWDATFDATGGAQSSFTDEASGVTMQVLAAEPSGAFRLRVKRP